MKGLFFFRSMYDSRHAVSEFSWHRLLPSHVHHITKCIVSDDHLCGLVSMFSLAERAIDSYVFLHSSNNVSPSQGDKPKTMAILAAHSRRSLTLPVSFSSP